MNISPDATMRRGDHDRGQTMTIRIGNCSGYYGDRLGAMREMIEGGDLDYLTGDYLAELTMLILGKDQLKDPALGYARTFVTQIEQSLALALQRGVRIVANAGGLNPAGLADRIRDVADSLGLSARVAYVDGDNLTPRAAELGFGDVLTANAYLGAFGIAEALRAGADIVITGRVTDASLVVGPAIAAYGWDRTSYDEIAGATTAGHIIECSTQATGGNFSGFIELPRDARPLGFPIAEVDADGSFVITKHQGTGGIVSIDTVTSQLVYEIQTTHYLSPDVTTDLTSIRLTQDAADRVRVSGVRGSEPPETLKVCVNEHGGFRNQMEFVLTGLNIDEKAEWVRTLLDARLAAAPPQSVTWTLGSRPEPDAATEEAASCLLRVTVRDPGMAAVSKAFTAATVELALASYPGFNVTTPPSKPSQYGIYRPEYVARKEVQEKVHLWDGRTIEIEPSARTGVPPRPQSAGDPIAAADFSGPTRAVPLGTLVHARSGDKGGDANVGVWIGGPDDARREKRVSWLLTFLTPGRIRKLLPEAAELPVEVYPLPNLGGVNVLVRGMLGDGVAASTRFDPQAKAVGEWLRSRVVAVPEELL